MSSPQGDSSPPRQTPEASSDNRHSSRSRSRSEKNNSPVLPSTGTDNASDPAKLLLSAVDDVRDIVRLVQCRICSRILQNPTTLPCGHTLCKRCIPQVHLRTNISWPATANRLHGFECPFEDCKREHAIGDCSVDITLNKVLAIIQTAIERERAVTDLSNVSTHVAVLDQWELAGLSSLAEKEKPSQVLRGGRLVSTYTLAETGDLEYGCEVSYSVVGASEEEVTQIDVSSFTRLKESVRTEMDCQVCYSLYLDPLTTSCGHTFCRSCLHGVLRTSEQCPICRRGLYIPPQVDPNSVPSNQRLSKICNAFWADLVAVRSQTVKAEQLAELAGEFDIPIFICTLSFPLMPTFLHVFEPRYRLMIRRAMDADRTFGMVPATRPSQPGGWQFGEIGTLLRIVSIEFFPDGRSLIETVGVSRFRVTDHDTLDGYVVARIEKLDDISLADEEALESSETMRSHGVQDLSQDTPMDQMDTTPETESSDIETQPLSSPSLTPTLETIETMSTRELVQMGVAFMRKMRAQSVSWLPARVLAIYGDCPADPAVLPWWFASVLPVSDEKKYNLLASTSVRERMKMCCRWIVEWESSRW